jgi:hypothetical protein
MIEPPLLQIRDAGTGHLPLKRPLVRPELVRPLRLRINLFALISAYISLMIGNLRSGDTFELSVEQLLHRQSGCWTWLSIW